MLDANPTRESAGILAALSAKHQLAVQDVPYESVLRPSWPLVAWRARHAHTRALGHIIERCGRLAAHPNQTELYSDMGSTTGTTGFEL